MDVPAAVFEVEKVLGEVLSDGKETPCIFDRFLLRFENFSERPVSSLGELKRRDNKRAKGLGWEKFCQFYLANVCQYRNVWLWNDIPENIRLVLKLKSKVDNGIDIVAQKYEHSGYVAVQCKYRKRTDQTVTWTTLSTFVGLCALTGPWDQHIVMTNCKGVSRKTGIEKGPKDKTIAYGTFKNLSRTDCTSHQVGKPSAYRLLSGTDGVIVANTVKTPAELRALRLAKFEVQPPTPQNPNSK